MKRETDDYRTLAEPDPPADTCFCGDPLTQGNWCGCAEGLYRLTDERQNGKPAPEQTIDEALGEIVREGLDVNDPAVIKEWGDWRRQHDAAGRDTEYADRREQPDRGDEDDDPTCVCGTARSEHRLLGCPEGFQTPAEWAIEREAIIEAVRRDREDRDYDGADDCDQGSDEIGAERQWSREARPDDQDFGTDADIGQLAGTQEWQAHQNAMSRIFSVE